MQILLPPSEAKTAPKAGPSIDVDGLFLPQLTPARTQVMAALIDLCRGDEAAATQALKLGARQRDEVETNARLNALPTAAAESVYSGVLYDALQLKSLPIKARDRAHHSLMIFSGLWGVVRPYDRIPTYRCGVGIKLPHMSGEKPTTLGTFWRKHLSVHLQPRIGDEFILDLRSGAYTTMWYPHSKHVRVRVLHARKANGRWTRSVVSHFNKATKGRMVADLLNDGTQCASVEQLVDVLRGLKYDVETSVDDPTRIDVIVTEI